MQQNLESLSKTPHSIEDEDVIMFAAGSLFSGKSSCNFRLHVDQGH